jgi:integrase
MAIVPHLPQHGIAAPMPGHTLADLIDAYEKDYLPLKAPSTQYQERYVFRWLRHELGTIALTNLTPFVLRTWRDSLRAHYQPNSIRRYMTTLSAVLTVAVETYAWLSTHPLRPVAKPPEPPGRERCLTPEEQTRLLAECQRSKNPHLYVAVVVTLSTATRKNELLQRLWTDLDLERGLLSIPRSKNKERRAIPLVPHALDVLRVHALGRRSPWVFPRVDGRGPWSVDYTFRHACKRAGIEDCHFHDLRHTCASYLAMSGASIQEIAMILGHRSLKQTMRYVHLVEPHTRGVLERMATQFLEAPSTAPQASGTEPPARSLLTTTPTMDRQVLDVVRSLGQMPFTSFMVAETLHMPVEWVRDLLQQWVQQGTLVRISKGYYRARPGSPDQAQEGAPHVR